MRTIGNGIVSDNSGRHSSGCNNPAPATLKAPCSIQDSQGLTCPLARRYDYDIFKLPFQKYAPLYIAPLEIISILNPRAHY